MPKVKHAQVELFYLFYYYFCFSMYYFSVSVESRVIIFCEKITDRKDYIYSELLFYSLNAVMHKTHRLHLFPWHFLLHYLNTLQLLITHIPNSHRSYLLFTTYGLHFFSSYNSKRKRKNRKSK